MKQAPGLNATVTLCHTGTKDLAADWVAFAESCTPRELELFGFPPPGHPIWTAALLDATAARYPKLDLGPWRASLT